MGKKRDVQAPNMRFSQSSLNEMRANCMVINKIGCHQLKLSFKNLRRKVSSRTALDDDSPVLPIKNPDEPKIKILNF